MLRIVTFIGLLLTGACAATAQQPVAFPRSTLTIITVTGSHRFNVEIARTPTQMERGLMFRRSLAANAGMLFDFGADRPSAMWMKNTYVPLDMIFIHRDGRVESIHYGAEPRSTRTITSRGPVRAVLEVRAGIAKLLGIRPGDRLVHPMFKPAK